MEFSIGSFQPNNVPTGLREKLTVQQWNLICAEFQDAEQTSHSMACVGECICCLLVGCWPIFFCHPCIAAAISRSKRGTICRNINLRMFSGADVLRPVAIGVSINIELIGQQIQILPQSATAQYASQPQYAPQHSPPIQQVNSYPVHSQPICMPADQNVYYTPNSDYIPIANAVPINSINQNIPLTQPAKYYEPTPVIAEGRFFELQVPMNAVPGQSSVSYITPDGRPGEIVVPANWVPGSLLRIPY